MFKLIKFYLISLILGFFSTITWAAPISLPTFLADTIYSFDEKGPFYNLDVNIKWSGQPATNTGTFAGFQFNFQNGSTGYIGTQIDSNGKRAIFSVWDKDVNYASAIPGYGCVRFGNKYEGSGSSCLKPYEWVADKEYTLRVWILDKTIDGVNWGAWIADAVTGEGELIGVVNVKNSYGHEGFGWLTSSAIGFHQNYGYGSVESCQSLPYSKVTWRGPYANSNSYTASIAKTRFEYAECANSNSYTLQRPFVTIESGSGVTRQTPSDSSLWEEFYLSVSRRGNGSGSVKSTPAGIDCGNSCSANFAANTFVTLTAQADAGSKFSGWGGACSGLSQQCYVRMTDAQHTTAQFTTTAPTRLITLSKAGNGLGFTSSNPEGLDCMAIFCSSASASFKTDTAVTITAQATGVNSYFAGWSGACSGTGTCYIPPGNTSANVTANFNQSSGGGEDGGGSGPLADPTRFVRQQYWDFIGITPDNTTINDSVNQLNAGIITRAQLVQSLMDSDIFGVFFNRIVRLYTAYFKRLPDYSGLMYWYGNIYPLNVKGLELEQISEEFAQSSEFFATYGQINNAEFITRVYQNVLGRDPEADGFNYWVGRLNDGISRGEVMVGFSESVENQRASANSQQVTLTYVGLLRRVPQSAEHARWLADIQAGRANAHDLINNLLQSPEYASRF